MYVPFLVAPVAIVASFARALAPAYLLAEVLLHPEDPRFAGKAIPIRNMVVVGGLSLLFPTLHLLGRRWRSYPVWEDDLYLSIFWLDMAGNSFDRYDRYYYFDLVPHLHGTGAVAVVFRAAPGLATARAAGLANLIHALLEGQEYFTDVFFGTHNVRGLGDTVRDLVAGVLGTGLYSAIAAVAWRHLRPTRLG
jgi:hypothetical protein